MGVRRIAGIIAALAALVPSYAAARIVAPHENVEYVTGDNTLPGADLVVQGDRLYAGAYGLGLKIYDISRPEAPRRIGEYLPGGRVDAQPDAAIFGGRNIVALNGTDRGAGVQTDFLDTTDPSNPVLLHSFSGAADGEAHNGEIVDARQLWLPSGNGGDNGLRIYDLSPILREPAKPPVNLVRANPVRLWEKSPYRGRKPVGRPFTHTHDITVYTDYRIRRPDGTVVRRDIALLAEGGDYLSEAGNTGSVFVVDITNPRSPVVLLRWLHASGEGHHPIRYHHEAQFLDGKPRLMLVTDEDMHNGCGESGGVTAVRLSRSLTRARELSEWFIPLGTPAAICSVHVFSSKGNLAFFGAYNAGLQVVDYTDPANPVTAGYYLAEGTSAWAARYHKGYIYVGDATRGLDVFRWAPGASRSELPLPCTINC